MWSFCLYELGANDLEECYKWSWREFQLKLHGYYRSEKQKWYHTRKIVYYSLVASANDFSKVLHGEERFLPLDKSDSREVSTEVAKKAFEKAMQAYKDKKK